MGVMNLKSGADEFLRGKPAVYTGFDGNLYVATFIHGEKNGVGVGHLKVANTAGDIIRDPLMGEDKARTFFWNLDAEAEG